MYTAFELHDDCVAQIVEPITTTSLEHAKEINPTTISNCVSIELRAIRLTAAADAIQQCSIHLSSQLRVIK
jgi:hypothetical protein